ncbi:hypothetical protein EDF35_1826 [Rathayibacter sp. PhB151]|uniref:hypothetical protein n=1 Tax=Rathayibacter sp. PhB151 TaxID=2485189 RepID=UPI001063ABDB|nr:hypothetical protein [Rathayibacter sp. PhB151]TDX78617.1 hypothetical protein EDF35_1826 [Rathayibacter sp. PhB151]
MDWFKTWWDSQAWGTAPDWFAAVGTVATFIGGIFLWRQDVKGKRRLLAEGFRVTVAFADGLEEGSASFDVRVHNTGNARIFSPYVSFFDVGGGYQYVPVADVDMSAMELVVEPDEMKLTSLSIEVNPRKYDPVVSFWDSDGMHWNRRIGSREYLTRKQMIARKNKRSVLRSLKQWYTTLRIDRIRARRKKQPKGLPE